MTQKELYAYRCAAWKPTWSGVDKVEWVRYAEHAEQALAGFRKALSEEWPTTPQDNWGVLVERFWATPEGR